MSSTGAKGSTQTNKSPRKGSNKKSKRQPKCALVWRTGLSGAPPDSVRCTTGHVGAPEDSNSNSSPSGNSRGVSAIIHRTVRCTPDSVRCSKDERLWNSPASGICSAIIHWTVRCTPDCPVNQHSNGYFAPTVTCRRI